MNEFYVEHYGTPRHSGRYPWGSGKDPYQNSKGFMSYISGMRDEGLSDLEIARGLGMTTTEFRERRSIAKYEKKLGDIGQANLLKEKGWSVDAIATRLDISTGSVRNYLKPGADAKATVTKATADVLRNAADNNGAIDIGLGVEQSLGISATKLKSAATILKDEGYNVYTIFVPQLANPGNFTEVKVLAKPGVTKQELLADKTRIKTLTEYSEDGGRTYLNIESPVSVNSSRVYVRYGTEGGSEKDGFIELRRGVPDISLGAAHYAQVRIAVDDTHYLKGLAAHTDNVPTGYDIVFNTPKNDTGNKLDAFKKLKDDPDNPFGSSIKTADELVRAQKHYTDASGKQKLSALNIVYEEGNWEDWSKTISAQVLAKQPPALAKRQLQLEYDKRAQEFAEIQALTNPAVKRALLNKYADACDAAAVHLKAAAMPRQRTQVIVPIPEMKSNEIFAPNFRNGETVVLIRYPHGGIFEIPELVVNNKNRAGKKVLDGAIDAVGINAKVASKLSGADFDGDTVLVIPNPQDKQGRIRVAEGIAELQNFDPRTRYPAVPGMKLMGLSTKKLKQMPENERPPYRTGGNTQQEMGSITNLIADMTIKGSGSEDFSEIVRAVKHSMVVIDAEKKELNYVQSAIDNRIDELKEKYQGGKRSGASTLLTRSSSETYVPKRKPRKYSEGGPIDKITGDKMYTEVPGAYGTTKTTRMAEVSDARALMSTQTGTVIERIYASHANSLKDLGRQARLASIATPSVTYSQAANKAYKAEVGSLKGKLQLALRNKPYERQAQLIGNAVLKAKVDADPGMDRDTRQKVAHQALAAARNRVGAKRAVIDITPKEWSAIQAGAVSNNMLEDILANADIDRVRELATPKDKPAVTPAMQSRIKSMLKNGATQAEVADFLGISASTVNKFA